VPGIAPAAEYQRLTTPGGWWRPHSRVLVDARRFRKAVQGPIPASGTRRQAIGSAQCPLLLAAAGGQHLTRRLFGAMVRKDLGAASASRIDGDAEEANLIERRGGGLRCLKKSLGRPVFEGPAALGGGRSGHAGHAEACRAGMLTPGG